MLCKREGKKPGADTLQSQCPLYTPGHHRKRFLRNHNGGFLLLIPCEAVRDDLYAQFGGGSGVVPDETLLSFESYSGTAYC